MNKLRGWGLKTGGTASRPGAFALAAACLLGAAPPSVAWAQAAAPAASPTATTQARPIKVALIESLSGTFANTGEAVYRNVYWAMERVNARGGVQLPASSGGARPLVLERYDSKGQNEEALSALRAPATILTSSDDPVIPIDDFRKLELPPNVELDIASYGGHCGFIDDLSLRSFTEDYIAERMLKHLGGIESRDAHGLEEVVNA